MPLEPKATCMQTDATTPNIAGSTILGVSCYIRVSIDVQTDVTTPNNDGTCSVSWEGYNP